MPLSDQGLDRFERYQFVPRVLTFLTRGDEVLLLKGATDKRNWPNLYNGLGGNVERGESVLEAAQREVKEESGLEADGIWLCAVVTIDIDEARGIVMFVFRGKVSEGKLKASSEGELEWVSRDSLDSLDLVEDIPILLPRVLDLAPNEGPLWGHYWYDKAGKINIEFH